MIYAENPYHIKSILFTLTIALITVCILSFVRVEVLVIESSDGSRMVFRTPILITIEYIHSVENEKVVEVLETGGGCIRLVSLKWQGYGAGMPSSLDDVNGGVLEVADGLYEVNMNRCLGRSVTVNLNYMVNGRLIINGISFSEGTYTLELGERSFLTTLVEEFSRLLFSNT